MEYIRFQNFLNLSSAGSASVIMWIILIITAVSAFTDTDTG